MPNFRKITAVMTCSEHDPQLTIILLDYDDPINTVKAITRDLNYLCDSIIDHYREIEDPSEFDPCDYICDINWVYCGYDFGTRCRAWGEDITEEEFNNPPDKWENATIERKTIIDYGDGTHEGI